jgi:two-component system capsular synthesis sensor histidine kinase RcsC
MQAHDSSARRFDGAGLGLSIARALVERQGGALEVASKPGEGSRFTVTLPLGRADRATFTSAGDTRVPVFAGRRVLYVEDVASNREVMAATLADTHAELTMAETGAEALEKLRAGTFDIALIDVQLPDTNGPALARAIRAEWPQLPMIAVTAQVADSAAAECRDAGMRGIVLKPIEPRQLFTEMTQHLDGVIEGAISLDGLAQIFAAQPERLRPMLATIAQEFRVHRAELEAAFAGDDLAQVRRVRHKAHSAIEQLSLTELRAVWTEVAEGNTALRPRCLALLDAAARELESRALQSFDAAAPAH